MEFLDETISPKELSPKDKEILTGIKRPQLLEDIGESMVPVHYNRFPDKQYFPSREMD